MADLIDMHQDRPVIQLDNGEVYEVEAFMQPADPSVGIMEGYVDDMEFYTTDGVHVELYSLLTITEYEQIKQIVWDAIQQQEADIDYDDYYISSGERDRHQLTGRMYGVEVD